MSELQELVDLAIQTDSADTWEEISQDDKGPIGSFRELLMNQPATQKKLLRTGMRLPDVDMNPEFTDEQDPTSDQD